MLDKPKTKQSRDNSFELLEKYRHSPCVICQRKPSDPSHIQSYGSGGLTEDWNLVSLCRTHHTMQHKIGFYEMSKKFIQIQEQLKKKGWEFVDNFGIMKLRRK